jgi:hypothetical protein
VEVRHTCRILRSLLISEILHNLNPYAAAIGVAPWHTVGLGNIGAGQSHKLPSHHEDVIEHLALVAFRDEMRSSTQHLACLKLPRDSGDKRSSRADMLAPVARTELLSTLDFRLNTKREDVPTVGTAHSTTSIASREHTSKWATTSSTCSDANHKQGLYGQSLPPCLCFPLLCLRSGAHCGTQSTGSCWNALTPSQPGLSSSLQLIECFAIPRGSIAIGMSCLHSSASCL